MRKESENNQRNSQSLTHSLSPKKKKKKELWAL
jgi:hypothetical protein